MTRRARRWNDLPKQLSNPGLFTNTRAWRDQEYKAGRPSGQLDFYRVHAICIACQGTGLSSAPVEWACEDTLFKCCQICLGSGRFNVS
jgi:excinuclease UvrABC ATPase subunit